MKTRTRLFSLPFLHKLRRLPRNEPGTQMPDAHIRYAYRIRSTIGKKILSNWVISDEKENG